MRGLQTGQEYSSLLRTMVLKSVHMTCFDLSQKNLVAQFAILLALWTVSHTFIEMFKIIKSREPRGLFKKILVFCNDHNNRILLKPNITHYKLSITEQFFV